MGKERTALRGEDTFRLKTSLEDLRVSVDRFATRPTSEQRVLANRALAALRFGLMGRQPALVAAAQQLVDALDRDGGFARFAPRQLGPSLLDASFEASLLHRLEAEFARGRLRVEREQVPSLTERRDVTLPRLPPLPPAPVQPVGAHSFEVRLVDEVGQGIGGVELELVAGAERRTQPTNAGGVGLFESVKAASGVVLVTNPRELLDVVDKRWARARSGKPPDEARRTDALFDGGALPPVSLKPELSHTLVIRPPPAQLALELVDKRGRARHAERPYRLVGPVSLEGVTDAQGRLSHEAVPNGDYALELDVELGLGLGLGLGEEAAQHQTLRAAAVALPAENEAPQVRGLGALPSADLVRLRGLFFDTNKSFVLPTGVEALRGARPHLLEASPGELLIVGHTDTSGEPDFNETLSLERAESVRALLEQDVDTWLAHYAPSKSDAKRWGNHEDAQMLQALPDFAEKPARAEPMRWFQRTRLLTVDGLAGAETRGQLIKEYMRLVGIPFSEDPGMALRLTCHGCGENFPLDESGDELDAAPADDEEDQLDRRVELFLFDAEFGIEPAAPGPISKPGSSQYPAWRKRARLAREELAATRLVRLRLLDSDGTPQDGAQYRARIEHELHFGVAKGGIVELNTATRGGECRLEWNPKGSEALPLSGGTPINRTRVFVEPSEASDDSSAQRMLHNLGYDAIFSLETCLESFQVDEGLERSAALDAATKQRLNELYAKLLSEEA